MPRRNTPNRRNTRTRRYVQREAGFNPDLSLYCFVCHKIAAHSEEEAWRLAGQMHERHGGEFPSRVYNDCGSGYWHWTRSE